MRPIMPIIMAVLIIAFSLLADQADILANGSSVEYHYEQGITFGFMSYGQMFCDPEYREGKMVDRNFITEELGISLPQNEGNFTPIPDNMLTQHIKDKSGDSVMVIWPGGKFRAVIKEIGYYTSVCDEGLGCMLEPTDPMPRSLPRALGYLVLRKGRFYDGPVIRYIEFNMRHDAYPFSVDFIISYMNLTWRVYENAKLEQWPLLSRSWRWPIIRSWEEHRSRISQFELFEEQQWVISTTPYRAYPQIPPDTMFVAASRFVGSNEFCWFALFRVAKSGDFWDYEILIEPWRGPCQFRFACAFDLNGDGAYEYLVFDPTPSIYSTVNGKLVAELKGRSSGCQN